MLKIALVSNELPPYRVPYFEAIGNIPGIELKVLFCTKREPNRNWDIKHIPFGHEFLPERLFEFRGRYIHTNPGIFRSLSRFRPNVVVTGGFNPTHLFAYAYAVSRDLSHVPMTDGTDISEQGLSLAHRTVRQLVFARSKAFVYASQGGRRLFKKYGISDQKLFQSCLCIDNSLFTPDKLLHDRPYDFLFCGRLEHVKNPMFAFEVALATAKTLKRQVSIRFVGAGAMEATLRAVAAEHARDVRTDFQGFTAHEDLPALYQSAKVFLFPTLWDPWGVVVNEACAAGTPILSSPFPGAAGELIIDGKNGYVRPLEVGQWAERAKHLLSLPLLWREQAAASIEVVGKYTYQNAARGLVDACISTSSRLDQLRPIYGL